VGFFLGGQAIIQPWRAKSLSGDDSAGHAGDVHDRLKGEFRSDLLFMDVDAIPPGDNFIKVLRDELARCDVLLALIGPNWLNVRDEQGNRRLDNPSDFLRIEIATALQRDIPVIPILLDGARMPKAHQLPMPRSSITPTANGFCRVPAGTNGSRTMR
jgi:hypothetical protein